MHSLQILYYLHNINFKSISVSYSSTVALSVSSFEVDKSLLTREVNTIVVTLTSTGQLSREITLSLGEMHENSCVWL